MAVSIYIVEDELWIRKGIKKMIQWQELDVILAGEAQDGAAAYEEILKLRPQIILSDIRIPKKDGLSMVREVLREYPAKAIFISGYRDFDYAREALTLDAVSYILKPIDAEELNAVIAQAVQEIRREEIHSMEADYGKESYLLNLLDERKDMPKIPEPPEKSVAYCVLLIPSEQLNISDQSFKAHLKECSGPSLHGEFFRKSKDEYVVIFSSDRTFNFGRRVAEVSEKLLEASKSSGFWALGDPVYGLSDIPLSYNHAWIAFSHRDVHPATHLLPYSSDEMPGVILPSTECMEKLRLAVETGAKEKITLEIQEIIKAMTMTDKIGMKGVADCIFYVCMDIIRLLQKDGISTGKYYDKCQTFLNNRFVFRDMSEIFEWFEDLLIQMADDVRKCHMKSAQMAVQKVKNYIDGHYTEGISLNAMAEMVYMNPNYLSTSFKKISGTGFSDYIIEKRMDKAAKILRETDLSVAEIALLVGYENVRHFSRLFRKYYGRTPTEFRENKEETPW